MVITQKYSREKWPHSKGLRQLAQMACILLGKNNHKSFKMWMIDKLYNLIVNKNRSLEFNSQPKRGGGGVGGEGNYGGIKKALLCTKEKV